MKNIKQTFLFFEHVLIIMPGKGGGTKVYHQAKLINHLLKMESIVNRGITLGFVIRFF